MLKSSLLSFTFSLFLMLLTVSGSNTDRSLESDNLYKPSDKILIAAHRGYHINFPENSIPAIKECIGKGIDIVEIDIRETKDKVPVLLHDKTLSRTTNQDFEINDVTFKEVKQFNLLFEGVPTEYKIPSLEEVLKLAKGKIILNLDFKLDDLKAMKRTYQLVSEFEMEDDIIFTINKLEVIPDLYKINSEIRIMPVAFSWWKINQALNNDFLDIIQLHHKPYWNYYLNRFDKKDMDIWVNALRKYDHMEKTGLNGFEQLIKIKKVNVIQTDYPDELLAFLREKGLHD